MHFLSTLDLVRLIKTILQCDNSQEYSISLSKLNNLNQNYIDAMRQILSECENNIGIIIARYKSLQCILNKKWVEEKLYYLLKNGVPFNQY
jgi:hypothetical protein